MRRCEFVPGLGARVVAPQRRRERAPGVAAVHWLGLLTGRLWTRGRRRLQRCFYAFLLIVPRVTWRFCDHFCPRRRDLARSAASCSDAEHLKVLALRRRGTADHHFSSLASHASNRSNATVTAASRGRPRRQLANKSSTTDAHACEPTRKVLKTPRAAARGPEGHLRGAHDVFTR